MIRTVIIDDEKHAVATLAWKLEKFCPQVELIGQFTDATQGLEFLRTTIPDLLFLDIEMPRLNGFEILEELGAPIPFDVVFTTAYDEFGIQAVKVSALDYLLKPIRNRELKEAIHRYEQKQAPQISSEQLQVLFSNIKPEPSAKPAKIGLSSKQRVEFVFPHDIISCTSDSNYTSIQLSSGEKRLLSKTLKDVEEMLAPYSFFRTHHSHLVNLEHIEEYIRTDGGYLIMSNGTHIPVSRNRREELLRLFV